MRVIVLIFILSGHFTAFSQEKAALLRKLEAAKADTGKVHLYLGVSRAYQYNEPDSAIHYARLGTRLSQKIHYRLGEAMLLGQLGAVNEKHDNLEAARKFFMEALTIYQQLNYTKGVASEYNGLGILSAKEGNYKKATSYFLKALKLCENAGHKEGIVQSYIKLGAVNERSGNFDKALEYYHRAKNLNGSSPGALYALLNNIGIVEAQKGKLREALEYFEKGAAMSDTSAHAGIHLNLSMNAANALKLLERKHEALTRFKAVVKKAEVYKLPEIQARTLINLSGLETHKALQHLEAALAIAKRIGQMQLQGEIYDALADYHKQAGNYKEALPALEAYYGIKDSLFSASKTRAIASMQASYELDKSKEQIKSLELSNQKRTAERNLVILGIASAMLACGGMWFYVQKVRRLNSRLAESNQVKDKLFSIIGHDLRSPLGSIIQMMDVVESGLLSEDETRVMVKDLKKHSEASLRTLDALLLWGKAQLQGVTVNKVSFESKPLILKTLAFFQRQIDQKLLVIIDQTPSGLSLFADRDHFDFVFRNLLANAIKFSYPSGRVRISVSTREKPGFAVFSIKDEGKGIDPIRLNQLFQPVIGSNDGTAGEKGTGLGLVLCKEFLEASGGGIWVQSKEGEGSVFYFSIPCNEFLATSRNTEKIMFERTEPVA